MRGIDRPVIHDRLALVAAILALILLAVAIATSPAKRVHDERWHLVYVEDVQRHGWLPTLTARDNDHHSAVGPVYPAFHLAFSPVTSIQVPAARWVTFICLLVVIALLALSVRSGSTLTDWASATSIIGIPFLWPTAGLALTEVPALVGFTLFVLCMLRMLPHGDAMNDRSPLLWAVLAGLALGMAILSRQTYLIVLGALVGTIVFFPRRWLQLAVVIGVAAISSVWLFIIWKGLLPPAIQFIKDTAAPRNIFLSLSYIAVATLVLRPSWMMPRNLRTAFGLVAAGAAVAMLLLDYTDAPGQSVLRRFGSLGLPVGFVVLIGMTSVGFLWMWNTIERAWRERHDAARVFLTLTLLALVAAPMRGFGFSSRYIVGALGVLILVVGLPAAPRKWLPVRVLAGAVVGLMSLLAYYRT